MADTAAARTEAWRRDQRRAGLRPVQVWLPADVKSELDALAYHRHQSITACLTDAVRCLAAQQNRQPPLRLESRQLAALKAEIRADTRPDIRAEILTTLAELGIAVLAPAPPDAPEPLTPIGPPPPGQKYCKRGHTYPTAKKECPQCAAARKRRHRHTQAQKRAGTIPTAHVASTT